MLRHSKRHVESYEALRQEDNPQNRLRRLETLNIFSLKASYLETFLKALEEELPRYEVERRVPVVPRSLTFGATPDTFKQYAARLPIFKVGRDDSEPRLVAILESNAQVSWSYFVGHQAQTGILAQYRIAIDYPHDQASARAARSWDRH